MIASLSGTLLHRGTDALIVDVNGVGYLVTVGARTFTQLGQTGQPVRLYTYTHVREDTLALYGFSSPEELAFFKLLLSVKGIGPKAALAILSRGELKVLSRAILNEDAALLSTIPGIGPKTAARVVLELKGKLREEMFAAEPLPGSSGDAVSQALAVLTGLGYTPGEAREAVRHAAAGNGGGRSVEELVTVALRGLDRRD